MKKSVVEKTSEHILKFNQELDRQREGQKEFLQQQAEKRKVWLEKITQGENLIRYSKWGVKAGYAVLAGGLLTSVFSPWRGLGMGIMAVGGLSIASNLWQIRRLQNQERSKQQRNGLS